MATKWNVGRSKSRLPLNRWASEDGRSLEKDAYIQLSRIYNSLANEMIRRTRDVEGEKNPKDEALNYFHKVCYGLWEGRGS